MARTRKTARNSTGPFGVPGHQLASRHEGSSSGSNNPIGDLEARVEQLRSELRHRNKSREQDSYRIAELSAEVSRLQYEISERDTTIDWAINSPSFAWDCEAKALARVAELSASLESLQVYCNTLHEKCMYCMIDCTRTCHKTSLQWERDHQGQQMKDLMGSWTFLGSLLP
jgi:glutamine synthetase type III